MSDRPRPVVWAARIVAGVVLLANGIPPLLLEFGWIDWTAQQLGAYTGFVNVVIAAASVLTGQQIESLVTPVADPKDDDGNVLVPQVPDPNPI